MRHHPNTPRRLVRLFDEVGSYHKVARARGVNVIHVHRLMTKGIEPTHETEKGRAARAALFLPRRPRKAGPRKTRTKMQKAISRMARATKRAVLRQGESS